MDLLDTVRKKNKVKNSRHTQIMLGILGQIWISRFFSQKKQKTQKRKNSDIGFGKHLAKKLVTKG